MQSSIIPQVGCRFPGGTDPGGLSPFFPCFFVVELLETTGKLTTPPGVDNLSVLQLKVGAESQGTVGCFI